MTCHKIPYESRAAAMEDARLMKHAKKWRSKWAASGAKNGRKLRAYNCPFCGLWHLTTQKPRKK